MVKRRVLHGKAAQVAAVPLALVAILFVFSGAAGLIYEVLWIRSLTLIFGKTVHAASAVLCAFMAGLAAGSVLGGRLVDRQRLSPLRLYALLEGGIALWALLLPVVFSGIGWLYAAMSGPFERLPATLSITRFVLATLAMMPATALMGATLPALSRWSVSRGEAIPLRLGLLYALNTLGGMAGCLAAGFFLLEQLGVFRTTLVAVVGNLMVAGIALVLNRREPQPVAAVAEGDDRGATRDASLRSPLAGGLADEVADDATGGPWRFRLVVAAVAVGGFAALALEVAWTRALLLIFGSTAYSFSAMLSVFLLGIGAGSLVMTPLAGKLRRPWMVLALMQGGIGILVLLSLRAVDHLPGVYLTFLGAAGLTYGSELTAKFLMSAALMLPATLLSGMVWPIAVRLARPRRDRIGADVGRLYAASTLGSIAGSLASGFLLLPRLGMQGTFALVSLVIAGFGALCALAAGDSVARRAVVALGILGIATGLALTMTPWDRRLLTSGAYFMPTVYLDANHRSLLEEKVKETRLVYYAEGVTTTPSVAILGDVNKVFVNDGKIEGGTAIDGMRLERMLSHLPALLHPGDPKVALNIGLGSGITAGALGVHPFDRIDCAEIEPVVVPAARQFDRETFSILDRPGFKLFYNDGRNHLMLTKQRYDVVNSMPFAPLVSGAASLYSLEHFRLVKQRLAPGGVMAQYLPLYQLAPEDFLSIMRTFAEVFPDATVWFMGVETVLIGGDGAQPLDFGRLAARMSDPRVAASLQEIGLDDPVRLLATYCFRVKDVEAELRSVRLNTDDRPTLEFTAPRSHLVNTIKVNLPWLIARMKDPVGAIVWPASWPADDPRRGQVTGRLEVAREAQRLSMEGRLQVLRGDLEGGIATLERALAADSADLYLRDLTSRNLVKLADRRLDAGQTEAAIAIYEKALTWQPGEFLALYNLARLVYDRGDAARAQELTRRALDRWPDSRILNYRMGLLRYNAGDAAVAESFLKRALDEDPRYPEPLLVLGDLRRDQGRAGEAAHFYREAIRLGRADAETYASLAHAEIDAAHPDEARAALTSALRLAPDFPEAIFARARLAASGGDTEGARRDLAEAIRHGGEGFRARAASDPRLRDLVAKASPATEGR